MSSLFWIIDFIMPLTMIFIGVYYFFKKSEQPIHKTSGFRTSASMVSRKSWSVAHKLAGKYLIICGIILCIYTFIIKLIQPLKPEWLSLINNAIDIIVYIAITPLVNSKLEKLNTSNINTHQSKTTSSSKMSLGERLKEMREKNNYTQENLAGLLHVTRQTISGWEHSRSEPDIAALQKLATIYNISIDELLKNVVPRRLYYHSIKNAIGAMFWLGIALSVIMLSGIIKNSFSLVPMIICFCYCIATNFVVWLSFLVFEKKGY